MPSFHNAKTLTPAIFGPETPLGLFKPDGANVVTLYWIVEGRDRKVGIALEADDPRSVFEAADLSEETYMTGISLGPVEVMVDLEDAQVRHDAFFSRGSITITGGQVFISAMPEGRQGARVSFPVGQAGEAAGSASATFTKWRLVQRDHLGAAVTLYEAD